MFCSLAAQIRRPMQGATETKCGPIFGPTSGGKQVALSLTCEPSTVTLESQGLTSPTAAASGASPVALNPSWTPMGSQAAYLIVFYYKNINKKNLEMQKIEGKIHFPETTSLPKNNLLAFKEEVPLGYLGETVRRLGNWGGGRPPDHPLPSALLDLMTLEALHRRPDAHHPWQSQPPSTYTQGGLELSTHSPFEAEIVRQYKTLRPQFLFFFNFNFSLLK